jgi:hypothetical protein
VADLSLKSAKGVLGLVSLVARAQGAPERARTIHKRVGQEWWLAEPIWIRRTASMP